MRGRGAASRKIFQNVTVRGIFYRGTRSPFAVDAEGYERMDTARGKLRNLTNKKYAVFSVNMDTFYMIKKISHCEQKSYTLISMYEGSSAYRTIFFR